MSDRSFKWTVAKPDTPTFVQSPTVPTEDIRLTEPPQASEVELLVGLFKTASEREQYRAEAQNLLDSFRALGSFPNDLLDPVHVNFNYPKDKIGQDTKSQGGQEACVVCMDNVYKTVNLPCGHACLCFACSKTVAQGPIKKCPICRVDLSGITALYKA